MKNFKIYLEKVQTYFESNEVNDLKIAIATLDLNEIKNNFNKIVSSDDFISIKENLEEIFIMINQPKYSSSKDYLINLYKKFIQDIKVNEDNYEEIKTFINSGINTYITDDKVINEIKKLKNKIDDAESNAMHSNFPLGNIQLNFIKNFKLADNIYSFYIDFNKESLEFTDSSDKEERELDFFEFLKKEKITFEKSVLINDFKMISNFIITKDKIKLKLEINPINNKTEYLIKVNKEKKVVEKEYKGTKTLDIDLNWNQDVDVFINEIKIKYSLINYSMDMDI
jgi:hypothetical protein